jgi:hypothetical protein
MPKSKRFLAKATQQIPPSLAKIELGREPPPPLVQFLRAFWPWISEPGCPLMGAKKNRLANDEQGKINNGVVLRAVNLNPLQFLSIKQITIASFIAGNRNCTIAINTSIVLIEGLIGI